MDKFNALSLFAVTISFLAVVFCTTCGVIYLCQEKFWIGLINIGLGSVNFGCLMLNLKTYFKE